MKKLLQRLKDLEVLAQPVARRCVCIPRFEDQTQDEATTVFEREHGPIEESGNVLRVFIAKPFPAPASA
jgi:hypothetical protein